MPTLNDADTKSAWHLAYGAKKGERYTFCDGVCWNVIEQDGFWGMGENYANR